MESGGSSGSKAIEVVVMVETYGGTASIRTSSRSRSDVKSMILAEKILVFQGGPSSHVHVESFKMSTSWTKVLDFSGVAQGSYSSFITG